MSNVAQSTTTTRDLLAAIYAPGTALARMIEEERAKKRPKPTPEEVTALVADVLRLARARRVGAYVTRIIMRLCKGGIAINKELSGIAYYLSKHEQILLCDPKRIDDVQWTLAHELGHHAIRKIRKWDLDCVDEEQTANAFAEALTGRAHPDARERAAKAVAS